MDIYVDMYVCMYVCVFARGMLGESRQSLAENQVIYVYL